MNRLPDCKEAVDIGVVKHEDWIEGSVFVLSKVISNVNQLISRATTDICEMAPIPNETVDCIV